MVYPDLTSAIEYTPAPSEIVDQLELVEVDYLNFDHRHAVGQLVIATIYAEEVQGIFGSIRDAAFPVHSIMPIAYFGHNDHDSIAANNTSAFNYRTVAGTKRLSRHSYGKAIDINPLLNPYVKADGSPMPNSFSYPGYAPNVPGTIVKGGPVVRAFLDRGWEWGGDWTDDHDYQHFNKE